MNPTRRFATIATALVAAGLLALAVQGGHWWTVVGDASVGEVTIGPTSSHRCFAGECRTVGLGWVGGGTGWARAGMATYTAGLCAALLLVISAAMLASRKVLRVPRSRMPRWRLPRSRLVSGSGLVAAVTAAVAGAAFFALYPGVAGTSISRGAFLYSAGIVLAIVAHLSVMFRAPTADAGSR